MSSETVLSEEEKSKIENAVDGFDVPGFEVDDYRVFRSRSQRIDGDDVFALVEMTTDNLNRFGVEYDPDVRRQIHTGMFDHFGPVIGGMEDRLIVDFYPYLSDNAESGEGPGEEGMGLPEESPEVVSKDDALKSGIIERNSVIDEYTAKWGVDDILTQGPFVISPDPVTMNVLDVFYDENPDASVIEFGAGIGASGYVAEKHGVKDFIFVEIDEGVAGYVADRFPSYSVENEDALQFVFDKDYDLAVLGIPYGLEPRFLAEQGGQLEEYVDNIVIQTGSPGFCQVEHDIMAGKFDERWPGIDSSYSVQEYFDESAETRYEHQLAVTAGPDVTRLNQRLEDGKGHEPFRG